MTKGAPYSTLYGALYNVLGCTLHEALYGALGSALNGGLGSALYSALYNALNGEARKTRGDATNT